MRKRKRYNWRVGAQGYEKGVKRVWSSDNRYGRKLVSSAGKVGSGGDGRPGEGERRLTWTSGGRGKGLIGHARKNEGRSQ